uniref:Uncharacterized protein n=1 Tax=Arundo donax TaxID=35708 RepID=A0A0A9G4U8_ARUDO
MDIPVIRLADSHSRMHYEEPETPTKERKKIHASTLFQALIL